MYIIENNVLLLEVSLNIIIYYYYILNFIKFVVKLRFFFFLKLILIFVIFSLPFKRKYELIVKSTNNIVR